MEKENDNPTPSSLDKQIEQARWKEEFYKQIIHELKTEERFVNFFKQYRPQSVAHFIENYAHQKVYWHLYGESTIQYKKKVAERWVKEGWDCMDIILQKKLFDLQCQFRGNKLKIPGVNITYQFQEMEECIYDCLFVDPVNETDLELFCKYLDECPVELAYDRQIWWQHHGFILIAFREPQSEYGYLYTDSWYDYHNRYTGNDIYLALPDERGEKEDFYKKLAWDEEERIKKLQAAVEVQAPKRLERMKDDMKAMELFAKEFDTRETYEKLKAYNDWHAAFEEEKSKAIAQDLRMLEEAKRLVPIGNADDWRDGVKWVAEQYRRQMVKEALPEVLEQYRADLAERKAHAAKDGHTVPVMGVLSTTYMQDIIRGRELNGEPADLNF